MTQLTWQQQSASVLQNDVDLQSDWDRLSADRLDLPFMRSDAVAAALAVFGTGQEVLLVGRQGPVVHAMLVLVPEGRLRWRTFQPSQLPLGAWVAASRTSLPALAHDLIRGPLRFCLVLSITQIDPLQSPRQDDTGHIKYTDYIDTAWLDVQGSFDDYWAARGKNLRQNMRKQRNKLAAEGIVTQLRIWTAENDMAPALARYGALESHGWKAGQGTAIEANNDQGRFYTRLFEQSARRGEALVTEYLFNDQTVAMNLGLIRGGTLVVLKTAYDESVPKALSPASLLREEELQRFHAGTEIRRIEYYGKVMDWHTKLTDNKRGVYHLTVYRWPLLKRIAERRVTSRSSDSAQESSTTAVITRD
jgi:CelD/BcsL family acetyltransferase involved in cellulose biosynthesis